MLLFVVLVIAALATGCSTTKSKSIAACWRSNGTDEILMRLNDDGSGTMLVMSNSGLQSFNLSWQKISDVVQVSVSKDKPEYRVPFETNQLSYDEKQDVLCVSGSTTCFSRVTC